MMRRAALLISLACLAAGTGAASLAGADEPGERPWAYQRPAPKEGFRYPDCYCTDSEGRRIELGQSACLRVGSRDVTARCEMSLNNPIWREQAEGCPGA